MRLHLRDYGLMIAILFTAGLSFADAAQAFPVSQTVPPVQTAEAIRISLVLALLALIPAMVLCMTPFVRIVITLSMIRHAFGMPETPPSPVLVSLALFLTVFAMGPTFTTVNAEALQPFLDGQLTVQAASEKGAEPLKAFMLRQVNDQNIKTVYDIARDVPPS